MGLSVLVVEDTELLRRMYSDQLVKENYDVLQASDGLEAIALLRTQTPDLILLDLVMPNMSGLEVLEIVKKDPRLREIPVLILSNKGQDEDMELSLKMGAADYLIKNDVRPSDVADKIGLILRNAGKVSTETQSYRLLVRDREGDADALVAAAALPRRFWCPACEAELYLELIPRPDASGWYDARFVCEACGRQY